MNSTGKVEKNEVVFTNAIGDYLSRLINNGMLSQFSSYFVITDSNTAKHCFPIISPSLTANTHLITFEYGEKSKNLKTCELLYKELLQNGADRNSIIINLGGGVTSDIGGFVASTFKRGLKYVNIPTSLMAMVDAAHGGKTGIDLMEYKNMIGTFALPEAVLVDPVFLNTLPDIEWKSGVVEMYKHALIDSIDMWENLTDVPVYSDNLTLNPDFKLNVSSIIESSVKVKLDIVKSDPLELNNRKILNLGHTIGHAVESLCLNKNDKSITHGEAVNIGLICELFISMREVDLEKNTMESVQSELIKLFPLRKFNSADLSEIISIIKADKKSVMNVLSFSLIEAIGAPVIKSNIDEKLILDALNFYNEL